MNCFTLGGHTAQSIARTAAALFVLVLASQAVAIDWDGNGGNPPDGTFGVANNWNPNTVPGASDDAAFNSVGTYTVTFAGNATSRDLSVGGGDVRFASNDASQRIYSVRSAFINGGDLQMGTQANPTFVDLHDTSTGTIQIGNGTDGTLVVEGSQSRLDVLGIADQSIGSNGATGELTIRSNATANIATQGGTISVGVSSNAATIGRIYVQTGSTLNAGNIRIATSGSGASGQISVSGTGTTVTQLLAGATLTVGSSGGDSAGIQVSGSAVFNTGTGAIQVFPQGNISVNDGGTFNANGNLTLDGGSLTKPPLLSGTFNLAAGKTLTVKNGGQLNLLGGYTTASNAIYEITGVASSMSTSSLIITGGTAINVAAMGQLQGGAGILNIGAAGTVGALSADGGGTLVSAGMGNWGIGGGQANVTFSNGAEGSFGNLNVADSTNAGTTAFVNVLSGAKLSAAMLRITRSGGSTTAGTLDIQGAGSSVDQTGTLTIGNASTGTAVVNVGTTSSGATFTNHSGAIAVNANSVISIGSAATTGTFGAGDGMTVKGTVNLAGGTMFARNTLTIDPAGHFNFSGGTLHAVSIVGTLQNNGGTLEPGFSIGTLAIAGDYAQLSASKLLIELGSNITTFDKLQPTGLVTLSGALEVELGSYQPVLNDTFQIITAGMGVSGTFASKQLPPLSNGLGWDVVYGANSVMLKVVPAQLGDFNGDTVVDAADYVIWRKNPGGIYTHDDYVAWRANFGSPFVGSGAALPATESLPVAVPEPANLLMMMFAVAGVCFCRHRSSKKLSATVLGSFTAA